MYTSCQQNWSLSIPDATTPASFQYLLRDASDTYNTDLSIFVKYLRLHRVISGLINQDVFFILFSLWATIGTLCLWAKSQLSKDASSHLHVGNCLVIRIEKNSSVLSKMVRYCSYWPPKKNPTNHSPKPNP